MELTRVNAISPVDGRYRKHAEGLAYYFSEAAFINYRVFIEVEYFIALCKIPLPQLRDFDKARFDDLKCICRNFTFSDADTVKGIEEKTNHDVKAVEYYVKKKFDQLGLSQHKEFLHFGLTSQDINNLAIPYAIKLAFGDVIMPQLDKAVNKLTKLAREWKRYPMLARTHGQPASPTFVGKEIYVFADRLKQQIRLLKAIPFTGKFGGATGNLNAHYAAYPNVNWIDFAEEFVRSFGLERQKITTQVEHYDNLAAFFDALKRINTILLDLTRDMWTYISMDYFKQKISQKETGSSTMPHKVNPIDFENSEGNLGLANALFEHLSAKLPISRLQRDLTDSTVSRNIGVPIAHTIIAINMLLKGLDKLILNEEKINKDLEENWVVVSEGIQTILRREGIPKPYELLKSITRTGKRVDKATLDRFIDGLKVSDKVKQELKNLSPFTYTGLFKI